MISQLKFLIGTGKAFALELSGLQDSSHHCLNPLLCSMSHQPVELTTLPCSIVPAPCCQGLLAEGLRKLAGYPST